MKVMTSTSWLLLIFSLPTHRGSERMRLWRNLKGLGCAALRDGVLVLPDRPDTRAGFQRITEDIRASEGSAWLLTLPAEHAPSLDFATLFDRSEDYAQLLDQIQALASQLDTGEISDLLKQSRSLQKQFELVVHSDYFPADAQTHTRQSLDELLSELSARQNPGEPHSRRQVIARLSPRDHLGRLWATRMDLWVDRVASAWLIRQQIDRKAQFLWLAKPKACPKDALGFDFDGATFSHVGHRVTFETLLAAFGLESDAALARLGSVVHALDAGGVIPPEAAGLEAILKGIKQSCADDDQFLKRATPILDALYHAFKEEITP